MKKLLVSIVLAGMLIGAGCDQTDDLQKKYEQREKLLYETIAELVEADKTRTDKVTYNFSIADLGMTKGQAIKTFGFPDYISCTYRKGCLWGVYKSTQWEYQRGICLYFENGILTSWQN